MTAVQTLQPKARRLTDVPPPEPADETDEPETPLEWYRNWCRECNEWHAQEGLPYEDPLTMEEIVAICKEVRAERYAKKQKKDSTCH